MPEAGLFREVITRFATGVTIVTGIGSSGAPVGFTANAVCSVSLEPELILVCADRGSASLPSLLSTENFAVSVLRAEDEAIARRFSGELRSDRFRELETIRTDTGPPVLKDALAWIACRVWKSLEAGDHTVLIGEVTDCGTGTPGSPLVVFRRGFSTVTELSSMD